MRSKSQRSLQNFRNDDSQLVSLGSNHLAIQETTEVSPGEAVDLFDLRRDVPPASEPVVATNRITATSSIPLLEQNNPFYSACQHSGSDTTSGQTGTSEDGSSIASFLDDEPIMSQKEQKKVDKFMAKLVGTKRKHR